MTTPHNAQPPQFQRELRYLVVKIKDANAYLSPAERDTLERLCAKTALGRIDSGKRALECVCIESDWPEYEPTWKAIETRMTSPAAPAETATPTPETDSITQHWVPVAFNSQANMLLAHARRLERERDQARAQLHEMQQHVTRHMLAVKNAEQQLARLEAQHKQDQETADRELEGLIQERDIAEDTADKLTSGVLGEPIDWAFHDAKWLEAIEAVESIASLRAQLKSMTDQFLAVSGQLGEAKKAVDDAYWRGYRARLDESTAETPEPTNPTLWRYLQNAFEKQITFHTIGVNRMPDGGFHFYIHPQSVSGETEDYLLWPDPFSWSDMLTNRKDIPEPDVEKFKMSIRKALAQSDSPGAGVKGEKS